MFCPNCGNNIPAGASFCPVCGASSAAASSNTAYAPASDSGVKARAMEILGSPLFLVACIVTLISFLITVIGWFRPNLGLLYSIPGIGRLMDELPIYRIYDFLPIINIFANIPTILEITGIVILLCKLKSDSKNSGFTFIKIGLIIELVSIAIICGIIAVILIIATFAAAIDENGAAAVVMLLITILTAGIFVMLFAYLKGYISTVGIASDAINHNKCTKRPSMFVIVINFMIIGSSIIDIFVSLAFASRLGMTIGSLFTASILPSILEAASILLFTLVMINGRSLADAVARPAANPGAMYGIDMSNTTPIADSYPNINNSNNQ